MSPSPVDEAAGASPLVRRLLDEAAAREDVPGFDAVGFSEAERFERAAGVIVATNRLQTYAEVSPPGPASLRPYTVWQRCLVVGVASSGGDAIDWSRFRTAGWGAP